MTQKKSRKRDIFGRLTIPLLIGLMLALPLTACGLHRAPDAPMNVAGLLGAAV